MILHMILKPNSINVLLFIQNIVKFLTVLPPRRLSLKHLPVSKIDLKRFYDFLADTSHKVDHIHRVTFLTDS